MLTLGYKDAVVLPLEVTPIDPARPVALRLEFAYGVCSDICMPEMTEMALDLPPDARADAGADALVALQCLGPLADLAFQLFVAANWHVQDLDAGGVDGRQRLALQRRGVVSIADADLRVGPVEKLGGEWFPEAVP